MTDALYFAAAATYAAACALLFAHLAGAGRPSSRGIAALALGAALHLAHDAVRWTTAGVSPFAGIAPSLSTCALLATGGFLVVRQWRPRFDVIGAFVAPAVLLMFLASRAHANGALGGGALLVVHILTNVIGLAAVTLASGMSIAYLLQERQVKARRLGGLFHRLPPLEVLDTATSRCLALGLPALTIGVVTGHVVAARTVHPDGLPWQQYFAMISWAVFAAVLLLRLAAGWRGRRAAIGTILGYASSVVVLLFYAVRGAHA
jgi:ABC-type uncharacterized transport system permease subunit